MCTCQTGMGVFVLQTALISDEKAEEFKHKVYRAIFLTQVAEYSLIALGSLCIVVAIVLVVISVPKKKYLELSIQVSRNRCCLILFLSWASNSHTRPMSRRFHGPVYFQLHFRSLFPSKVESSLPVYVRVLSYKHQKKNLNSIKRSKDIIFRFAGFADWFIGLERFAPKPFQKESCRWKHRDTSTRMEVALSGLMAPAWPKSCRNKRNYATPPPLPLLSNLWSMGIEAPNPLASTASFSHIFGIKILFQAHIVQFFVLGWWRWIKDTNYSRRVRVY